MTYRAKSGKYEVCRNCGAHLDHGERYDCMERENRQEKGGAAKDGAVPLHTLHI